MSVDRDEVETLIKKARSNLLLRQDKLESYRVKSIEATKRLSKAELNLELYVKSLKEIREQKDIDLEFYKANRKLLRKERDTRDGLLQDLRKFDLYQVQFESLLEESKAEMQRLQILLDSIKTVIPFTLKK